MSENKSRFCGKDNFKVNIFLVVYDSLISNIKNWSEGYKTVNNKFKSFFYNSELSDFSIEELKCYEQDLNLAELKNDVIQLTPLWSFIQDNNIIATFPNLNTILSIYLILPISNASGERSFSQNKT